MRLALELADAEAMRLGSLLAEHPDQGVRALSARLLNPDYLRLAALVEQGLRAGMKRTTNGTGARAWAIKQSGLQVSEPTAWRAWKRHYGDALAARQVP